jgi:SAM-dependent methyltransferase
MRAPDTSRLYDKKQSEAFYEDRYQQGYMDEWPVEKKQKLFAVIQDIQLPATGEALDFGCGNGILTDIIRQALPSWKVYGTDISNKAVANAKMRYPDCTFFEADNPDFTDKKFDFVFTNHVFEHVFNVREVFMQMDGYLKPESSMLHFLPCGNEGSYEHNICLLRKDGINAERENRFFFEDEGHLRRLTTDEFCRLCAVTDFQLHKEFYSNHYYEAIDWITRSHHKFVLMFSSTSRASSADARRTLHHERIRLLCLTALRLPARIVEKVLHKREKQLKHYALLLLGLPLYVFSCPIDRYWKRKAREEWNSRKTERNGSEMCLYFKRSSRKD